MSTKPVALVVGVGPGLGASLGRRFGREGLHVVLAARQRAHVDPVVEAIKAAGGSAEGHALDTTDEAAVAKLFSALDDSGASLDLAVYNASGFMRASIVDASAAEFERGWRVGCFGGFLVGRAAAQRMAARGAGTILFTGATASRRGTAQFFNFAVGKFGLRALAESMARELQPKGVHIAHIVIDGQIHSERYAHLAKERPPDGLLAPDAIAETYWQLHRQPRSAWTFELEVRPWVEKF
ncbi:MAG: SDR family NAD(P)-dependent oxidoreductase [Alphaproteobacteria bacterium]|nr:SDR family NAD(P)-dependent oxidoreductase [Alphaproteobacteria bacterium]